MTGKYESDNNRDEAEIDAERYAAFSDGSGGTVVYDTQNDAAWLKSDAAVEITEMT
ncbi:DUF7331 family protein [Halorussus ruber]|uniref:DUF7331 family protein n=1 Tax=Halorussus ruber TaxID=1126238 RepID=UPI00143DD872|nr:hypothetical protein [Halorussus ruber]